MSTAIRGGAAASQPIYIKSVTAAYLSSITLLAAISPPVSSRMK